MAHPDSSQSCASRFTVLKGQLTIIFRGLILSLIVLRPLINAVTLWVRNRLGDTLLLCCLHPTLSASQS